MPGIICRIDLDSDDLTGIAKLAEFLNHRGRYLHTKEITSKDFNKLVGEREICKVHIGIQSESKGHAERNIFSDRLFIDSIFYQDAYSIFELLENAQGNILRNGNEKLGLILGTVAISIESSGITVWRSGDGQRAIYVGEDESSILFAPEKKALWSQGFKNIRPIEPFEVLTVVWNGDIRSDRMGIDTAANTDLTQETGLEMLARYLRKSIDRITSEDRGILFSGGVDSALLAHLCKELPGNTVLLSANAEKSYDAMQTVQAAKYLDMNVELVEMSIEDIWASLPEVVFAAETSSRMDIEIALPFFLCSREGKKMGLNYILSGQGPDELFAGYAKHVRLFQEYGSKALESQLRQEVSITHESNISRDERVIAANEVRAFFPYLNPQFMSLALSLPADWKIGLGRVPERKILFRQLAKKMGLSENLVNTPKKATQYSSGSSKLLTKAIIAYGGLKDGLSNKDIDKSCRDLLENIAILLGFPTKTRNLDKSRFNLEPAYQFMKDRGISPLQ